MVKISSSVSLMAIITYSASTNLLQACASQLFLSVHDFASALNKSQQVKMAVLDFSKAFDKVPQPAPRGYF